MTAHYLTPKQVAQRLAVSTETIRAMCRSGKLTHVRVGIGSVRPPIRIPVHAVEQLEQVTTLEENPPVKNDQSSDVAGYLDSWRKPK